jgi:hypothetical protein
VFWKIRRFDSLQHLAVLTVRADAETNFTLLPTCYFVINWIDIEQMCHILQIATLWHSTLHTVFSLYALSRRYFTTVTFSAVQKRSMWTVLRFLEIVTLLYEIGTAQCEMCLVTFLLCVGWIWRWSVTLRCLLLTANSCL